MKGQILQRILGAMKWKAFSVINWLVDLRSSSVKRPAIHNPSIPLKKHAKLIWVFCSTIGELNACKPFIASLENHGQLVLITDRSCYRESYQHHFNKAIIVELSGRNTDGAYLRKKIPPSMFIICEIPAKLSDAPCRLSYSLLNEAKSHGAKIFLVNAWLYGYPPSCHMDRLEVKLFSKDYLLAFDFITTQDQQTKENLIASGVDTDRISVTGNMKFDSIGDTQVNLIDESSGDAIDFFLASNRPILVAGCLADLKESYNLFSAILTVRKANPKALFILAPRHPENPDFMSSFLERLNKLDLSYQLKSTLKLEQLNIPDLLILDTFGELKSFYSVATVCYVGCNHNVLEPLSYGKPTLVSGSWNALYPSYPVYLMTKKRNLILTADTPAQMAHHFISYMNQDADLSNISGTILSDLQSLSGAVQATQDCLNLPTSPINKPQTL